MNHSVLKWLNVLVEMLLNKPHIVIISIDKALEVNWIIPVLGTIDPIFFSTST